MDSLAHPRRKRNRLSLSQCPHLALLAGCVFILPWIFYHRKAKYPDIRHHGSMICRLRGFDDVGCGITRCAHGNGETTDLPSPPIRDRGLRSRSPAGAPLRGRAPARGAEKNSCSKNFSMKYGLRPYEIRLTPYEIFGLCPNMKYWPSLARWPIWWCERRALTLG